MTKKLIEDDDPFDIFMTMGLIISGRTRHLEQLLQQIKATKNVNLIFTKTSAGKLKLVEEMEMKQ